MRTNRQFKYNNNNNNGFRVRFGVRRRHRGPTIVNTAQKHKEQSRIFHLMFNDGEAEFGRVKSQPINDAPRGVRDQRPGRGDVTKGKEEAGVVQHTGCARQTEHLQSIEDLLQARRVQGVLNKSSILFRKATQQKT